MRGRAAETARELGIRHIAEVEHVISDGGRQGPKVLRSFFDAAQKIARYETVCYANCDIVLGSDFAAALELISKAHARFLMIGRRWDTDITKPLDFTEKEWDRRLQFPCK